MIATKTKPRRDSLMHMSLKGYKCPFCSRRGVVARLKYIGSGVSECVTCGEQLIPLSEAELAAEGGNNDR